MEAFAAQYRARSRQRRDELAQALTLAGRTVREARRVAGFSVDRFVASHPVRVRVHAWHHLLVMLIWGAVAVGVALRRFRWEPRRA